MKIVTANGRRRLVIVASELAGGHEFYHGTDSPPFDSFDPGKAAKGGRHYNPLGDAMYVTDKPEFARLFGRNVYPVRIPPGAKIRRVSPSAAGSAIRDIVVRALRRVGMKWWDMDLRFKVDVSRYLDQAGISPYDAVMEIVSYMEASYPEIADKFAESVSEVATEKFSKYDVVVFVGTNDPNNIFVGETPTKEILIFNKEFQKVLSPGVSP